MALKRLVGLWYLVSQRHAVIFPLAVIFNPLGAGGLFFAVSVYLLLRARIAGKGVFARIGKIFLFLYFFRRSSRRRPREEDV